MEVWDDIVRWIRWQDIIDVGILSFVLFRVYLWARGTVALQVLGGIGGIVAAALIAERLGLRLTASAFRALGAVATLVIVVVFQREIRRVLLTLNPLRWWRRNRVPETDTALETLAEGARLLADNRIGALLVIPQSEPIDEHASGGTRLDARLSPELLEAVFHTSSPIHDGAAILERSGDEMRLGLCGAVLPLSTNDLPAELGTRHRAALGLTEECDATVVVISEERGTIAIVQAGKIEPVTDPSELAARLGAALSRSASPRLRAATSPVRPERRRRRIIDLAALVIIVAAVGAVWYTALDEPATEVSTDVPVELREVPDGHTAEIIRPADGEVRVRIRGPRQLLVEGRDQVQAWVMLDGKRAGRHRIAIETSTPEVLQVVEVTPRRAVLRLVPNSPE